MDYKKKYKEALELMKDCIPDKDGLVHIRPCEIFPELKKSEDERIRKEIKSFFDSEMSDYGNVEWRRGIRYGEIVAWLEKQGKQKPIDKVEPKFKVGDVVRNISNGDTVTITQIDKENQFYTYSGWDGVATVHSDFSISEQDNWELVEQKSTDKVEMSTFKDKLLELFQKFRWKSTPTNGDIIEYVDTHIQELINTIRRPTWGEEDEAKIVKLKSFIAQGNGFNKENRNKVFDLIDSLKPRCAWKPSDEQMEALWNAIPDIPNSEKDIDTITELSVLYEDLKKLREE